MPILGNIKGAKGDTGLVPNFSVSALKSTTGKGNIVFVTDAGKEGIFKLDSSDITTAENGGTVLVDSEGKRWKRTNLDSINIKQFGAKGDGFSDDTQAVQFAINSLSDGGTLRILKGTYKLSSTIVLKSNINIIGEKGSYINFSQNSSCIFDAKNCTNVDLSFIDFTAPSNQVVCVNTNRSKNISIRFCSFTNCRILYNDTIENNVYSSISDLSLSSNINISFNTANGSGFTPTDGRACIEFNFVKDSQANNNYLFNYRFGIQYWGGGASTSDNGGLSNTRWASNLKFSQNSIIQTEAGIWGSMGYDIIISDNVIKKCADVGLDVEGTFFANISNNNVSECVNGCLSTFYLNKSIKFVNNNVYSTIAVSLFQIYNDTQSTLNKDIYVQNNTFSFLGSDLGFCGQVGENAAETIVFSNNTLNNCKIQFEASQNDKLIIEDNILNFTNTSNIAFNAIKGTSQGVSNLCFISNNKINSTNIQPSGSRGIYCINTFYNGSCTSFIKGNYINNFPIDIETLGNSGNAGITPTFLIESNIVSSQNIVRAEGSANKSKVILVNNKNKSLLNFPSNIPTSGKWDKGQIVFSNSPDVDLYIGFVCITAGTPGTWKGFGLIQT